MNTDLFTVWMAGFYEGEGYVCNDKSNNNRIRLGIDQNDPTPLIKAQKNWGGSVRQRIRKSPHRIKFARVMLGDYAITMH